MKKIYSSLLICVLLCLSDLYAQNRALKFDEDSYVSIAEPATSTGNFTFEAWVKIGDIVNEFQGLYWSETGNKHGLYLHRLLGTNEYFFGWYEENTIFYANQPLLPGEWHHIAITYDGNDVVMYVNGAFDVKQTPPANGQPILPAANVFMGDDGIWSAQNTILDEVRIWDYARSESQILATRDSKISLPQNGLLCYFDFDQGVAEGNNVTITTLQDRTGLTSNGILTNFSLTGPNSNWVAGTPAIVLPLTLVSFTGSIKQQDALLQWHTTSEENVSAFDVENSTDGKNWTKLKTISAANRPGEHHYSFTHSKMGSGDQFYRLLIRDLDGSFKLSHILLLNGGKGFKVNVYPNPAVNTLQVVIPSLLPSRIMMYDLAGKLVLQQTLTNTLTTIPVDPLKPGMYFVTVINGNQSATFRIMKQ